MGCAGPDGGGARWKRGYFEVGGSGHEWGLDWGGRVHALSEDEYLQGTVRADCRGEILDARAGVQKEGSGMREKNIKKLGDENKEDRARHR